MKKIFFWIIFTLFSIFSIVVAKEDWYRIDNYSADFEIKKDGIIYVDEKIELTYQIEWAHGFYRDIPYLYEKDDWKYIKTPIINFNVNWYAFQGIDDDKNGVFRIRIGNADTEVSWTHIYNIHYEIKGTVRDFGDHQQLYRNLLGTQRKVPINNYKFTFKLPQWLQLWNDEYYAVYWKLWDGKILSLIQKDNTISNKELLNLHMNEGVTIDLKFPKNYFPTEEFPANKPAAKWNLRDRMVNRLWGNSGIKNSFRKIINYWDNWVLFIIGIIFLSCYIGLRWTSKNLWTKKEVDTILNQPIWTTKSVPSNEENIPICSNPPIWYTPAEIACINEQWPSNKIYATLLYDWLGKGYITINKGSDSKNTIYFQKIIKNPEFEFDKKYWIDGVFSKWPEKTFWDFCFNNKHEKFYPSLIDETSSWVEEIIWLPDIYFKHTQKTLYNNTYLSKLNRNEFKSNSSIILLLLWIALFYIWVTNKSFIYIIFSILVLFFCWYLFSSSFSDKLSNFNENREERLSSTWKDIIKQIKGYKKYLSTIKKEAIQRLVASDPTYINKHLPYAIALGVGNHRIDSCFQSLEWNQMISLEQYNYLLDIAKDDLKMIIRTWMLYKYYAQRHEQERRMTEIQNNSSSSSSSSSSSFSFWSDWWKSSWFSYWSWSSGHGWGGGWGWIR